MALIPSAIPRKKLPITGLFVREDASHFYTDENGAIVKWHKAYYHK